MDGWVHESVRIVPKIYRRMRIRKCQCQGTLVALCQDQPWYARDRKCQAERSGDGTSIKKF